MFMGVGNLICIPLAMAIGRRPVYLGSLVLLVAGGVLAAYAEDYNWHLGARMLLGFSAGNSETLVPMMIQASPIDLSHTSSCANTSSRRYIFCTSGLPASRIK